MTHITKFSAERERLEKELLVARQNLEDAERQSDSQAKTILRLAKENTDLKEKYEDLLEEKEAIFNVATGLRSPFKQREQLKEAKLIQNEVDEIPIIEISSDPPLDQDPDEGSSDEGSNFSDREVPSQVIQATRKRNHTATKSALLKQRALDAATANARHEYDVRVFASHPFPTHEEQHTIARTCLKKYGIDMNSRRSDYSMLKKVYRGVNNLLHKPTLSNVREVVEKTYGLSELTSESQANRSLYRQLVQDYAYIYKDPKKRIGIFENSAIQTILEGMLTQSNRRPFLLAPNSIFNPVPCESVAFVLTVRFCLDEWETGVYQKARFYREKNEGTYKKILNVLKRWEGRSRESSLKLRSSLYTSICDGVTKEV
ncbi:hypothetical protein L218DRAFT_54480 [Marasmius fiardii PR-910]|nr:hypothetical protein L218DRAFT_54480 [Marasmius fiardii PR-910]